MTIDWKKFEDEVPTEPQSVVTFGVGHGGALLVYDGLSLNQGTREVSEGWSSDTEDVWHQPSVAGDREAWWRESAHNRGWTHWAYIDPPEDA